MHPKATSGSVEPHIRGAFKKADFDTAATLFMQHFGSEIVSFLAGRLKGEAADVSEVFSQFAEDFWRGLPNFRWRTTIRGWAYALARNAAYRYIQQVDRQREREITYNSKSANFARLVSEIRAETKRHLRTEVKDQLRALREQLDMDDQTLLVLRVDRQLSWKELAVVLSDMGEQMERSDIIQWSARLRQRFQTIKKRLKELAIAEGLLDVK
ncbi:MAG: sigma factor [Myxococcota bacterium]|nr:sigma factor [Myxococcota bacterium]